MVLLFQGLSMNINLGVYAPKNANVGRNKLTSTFKKLLT